MARGFYSTDGSGTSDALDTGYSGYTTQFSFSFWAWRTGNGGGDLARLFDKDGTSTGSRYMFYSGGGAVYGVGIVWTLDSSASWTFPQNSTGAWAHFAITYDGSSTSNTPAAYINGVSQTMTLTSLPPNGTLDTSGTGTYRIGNRSDSNRGWNGRLAEFAHWDRVLTAAEIAALANGYAPAFFPSGQIFYYPMLGRYSPENDRSIGTNYPGTITGTAYQAHPRIIYPSHLQRFARAASTLKYPQLERGIRGLCRGLCIGSSR